MLFLQSVHNRTEQEMKFLLRLHQYISPIALVLISTACGVIQAAEPTIDVREVQTSVFLTIQAEVTLNAPPAILTPIFTAAPTSTEVLQADYPNVVASIFTAAPTSTEVLQADYPNVVASRFQALQVTFVEFIEIHNQLTTNPNISRNMDWYSQAVAKLVKVTNGAAEIARMNNYPPEFETFHQHMQNVAAEGNVLFSNYMLALDNQDLHAQNQATSNLSNMITALNQAFAELNRLIPMTPAATTITPSPTN